MYNCLLNLQAAVSLRCLASDTACALCVAAAACAVCVCVADLLCGNRSRARTCTSGCCRSSRPQQQQPAPQQEA